jgi:hypothetical protein
VLTVKSTNRSTLTIEINGTTRTFKDGEGIRFARNVGGKRSFTADQIEFLGYGLDAPLAGHNDYAGKQVKDKVVVYLGSNGPQGLSSQFRRALFSRGRYATDQRQAVAALGPLDSPAIPARPGGAQTERGVDQGDFTTVQSLDHPLPPTVGSGDELFEFLLSGAPFKYSELKDKAAKQEPLPTFSLQGVKLTFNLEAEYRIVRTQYTRNVVGIVEGTDPRLKDTYVTFGAHYDHVGYAEGEIVQSPNGPQRQAAVGRVKQGALEDRIWNGADDDGSGTATLLGIAKAFATGPKPKRSLMFLWYTGEERGLWGSRYYADYPSVPLDKIIANLNMDMVGRDRDDKTEESNTVYLVGSDRISTELHNLTLEANGRLSRPLKLDFELNDPTDLEQVYYRSDHYSYAAKGIPVVFFTTALHPDYHANTDSVEKINFEKMTRIGQLVYETGLRVANLDRTLARDNRGPRVGKGSDGKIVD